MREDEPGLWKWFSSSDTRAKHVDAVRLDLLKSTYRIDPETRPQLYDVGREVGAALGLGAPLTCYQAQGSEGLNASLAYVPGEIHVVFAGPVFSTLSNEELRALLGHELAHFRMLSDWEGDFLVAADLLRGLCRDPQAAPVHHESLRLFALYGEVFADRGALLAVRDAGVAIATLVKMATGLVEVSAESYLKQADEIFRAGRVQAGQLTHPESYIRARALKLWADRGAESNDEVRRMIEGPWSLEQLDFVRQRRVSLATRNLLAEFLKPAWMRTEGVLAHARLFFADFDPDDDASSGAGFEELLASAEPSLRDYLCYVLLDFVTVDRELAEPALAAAILASQRFDLATRFGEIAMKELGLGKKQYAKLARDAEAVVAQTNQAAATS